MLFFVIFINFISSIWNFLRFLAQDPPNFSMRFKIVSFFRFFLLLTTNLYLLSPFGNLSRIHVVFYFNIAQNFVFKYLFPFLFSFSFSLFISFLSLYKEKQRPVYF